MMGVMATGLEAHADASPLLSDFTRWMAAEQRRVFLLCYRILQDSDEADSATQDTFLKAYRALNHLPAPELEDPAKWITRIAVNTCLDRLRSRSWKFWQRRQKPAAEEVTLSLAASGAPSAEDRVYARQIGERLNQALDQLSPRQRAVFTLRHYEDRSLAEIAEILGLDMGTVKAHMARALAKLRQLLKDLYLGEESSRAAAPGSPGKGLAKPGTRSYGESS